MANRVKHVVLGTVLVLAGSFASAASPREAAKPFLWKACDADSCVYLLGTFHALTADDRVLAPEVEQVLNGSDRFYFEVDPAESADAEAVAMRFMRAGLRADGKKLGDTLDPETDARLRALLVKHARDNQVMGMLSALNLDGFKAWYVALLLTLANVERSGLDAEHGLDKQLEARLQSGGKEIHGLESVQTQIDVFDRLGEREQQSLLNTAIDEFEAGPAGFAALRKAWLSGESGKAWDAIGSDVKLKYPELYARIQTDRNRVWAAKIRDELVRATSGSTLMMVGTMHLLGPEGLPTLLQKDGYKVERICRACKPD